MRLPTAQRVHSAFCCIASLLNCHVTPRIGADILVEAMPGRVSKKGPHVEVAELEAEVSGHGPPAITTFSSNTVLGTTTPSHPPAMAATPSIRQFTTCLRCVRQLPSANGTRRLLSTSAVAREELHTPSANATPPPPPSNPPEGAAQKAPAPAVPEYMQKWGTLDPQMVENKKQERRLLRREHALPVGSRRRRAVLRRSALQKTPEIPFEQLPYQCFQEARKFLLEDRQEKIKEIETQQLRIKNLMAQDPSVSGGPAAKEHRLRSMRKHLNELIILADINDPVVKKRFEDGQGRSHVVAFCA